MSALTFTPPTFCIASQPKTPSRSKPRAPPSFSKRRSQPRPWVPDDDPALIAVAIALDKWRQATSHPPGYLPSDSHLRRCDVAKELRLHSLIARAGGYRAVQSRLGLQPLVSSNKKELEKVAKLLAQVCEKVGRPLSANDFPRMGEIRRMDPRLGNRIAALPGRNGWHRMRELYGAESILGTGKKNVWRVWTDPERIRTELLAYQLHPQVLPRLCAMPTDISAAIQRQGGAKAFVQKHGMVMEKDWENVRRFAKLVRWLALQSLQSRGTKTSAKGIGEFLSMVEEECENPPKFPSMESVLTAGFAPDLQRYGGRKSLSSRLGFERVSGLQEVFLGPFSVTFAATLLEYAVEQVDVSECSVAMPSLKSLKVSGRHDLVAATEFFGGEHIVGRRVGLVPTRKGEQQHI